MSVKMRTNLDEAVRSIQSRLDDITTDDAERFMHFAIDGISLHTAGYIPIDTSNLINSETRQVRKTSIGFTATLEYTADYAGFVHDAPGTLLGKNVPRDRKNPGRGNVWSPTGEPDFLAKGARDFIEEDLDALVLRFLR